MFCPTAAPTRRPALVAPTSRFNIWVDLEDPRLAPAQIVVERACYRGIPDQPWAAGTNALATKIR